MKTIAAAEDYTAAFFAEAERLYPVVDAFEEDRGFRLEMGRLLAAARVLACPVKAHAPNWQHGRIIYAAAGEYLTGKREPMTLLDIGTAKGFSALCLQWALDDAGAHGAVVSVDILDPNGRESRNSVLECDGPKTLAEFLAPWPEASRITFLKSTGIDWLKRHPGRVNVAFIDGKHTGAVVHEEGKLLAERQETGDLAIFDDVQMDGIALAVKQLEKWYLLTTLRIAPGRAYAVGYRR